MTEPREDAGARRRAAQPPAPEADRVTAPASRHRPRRVPVVAALVVAAVTAALVLPRLDSGATTGGRPVADLSGTRLVGDVRPVASGTITARDVAQGQLAFGLELLARRCAADPAANQVLSPASAALALGMLATGADGDTRASLDRLLRRPGAGTGLSAAQRQQTLTLQALSQVQVSNHVFTQDGVRPLPSVLDELATSYASDLRVVDFAGQPALATATIDRAVDEDTHGLIPRLFGSPLDPSTVTVLTNAIHLQAAWQQDFGTTATRPFRTAAGAQVQVQRMDGSDEPGELRTSGDWTSVTLPYRRGELQAVVLLPGEDVGAQSCQTPDADRLTALTGGPSRSSGVDLPMVHLEQTSELTATLAAMGLPLGGDYGGFGLDGTSVSQVVQKTVLDVDGHGTTAAAATGIAVAVSARLHPVADRPFYLLIDDVSTSTPLFLAYITDPSLPG